MNARTSILTAVAMIAVAVTAAAGAATTRADTAFRTVKQTAALHELGQTGAAHKNRAVKSGKAVKKTVGKSSKQSVSPVIYIYQPGPATPPSAVADPNECEDSGNNCTDQQACEFWGMNCDSISTTDQTSTPIAAPVSDPAAQTPDVGTATPPPTDTGAFNASNCSDYYDYINTGDPSYC